MKTTRADRNKKAPPLPALTRPASPRRRLPLLVIGVILLGLAGLAWWLLAGDDTKPPGPAPEGMVWIPPGRFDMGESHEESFRDARPVHEVRLDGFWMDRTEVTNAQFAKFVKETKYVTVAEQQPDPEDFPGVPK